jgi:hypothetical protein
VIVGQNVTKWTNSLTFYWMPLNEGSFSTDMYGRIFRSFSVWYNFSHAFFLPKPSADHRAQPVVRGPQFEKRCSRRLYCSTLHCLSFMTSTATRKSSLQIFTYRSSVFACLHARPSEGRNPARKLRTRPISKVSNCGTWVKFCHWYRICQE